MSAELGHVTNASGSSLLTMNDTTQISCAVYHTEVKARHENAHRATIEVILKPLNGKVSHKEREYENVLCGCLQYAIHATQYPRTLIRVVIQVMREGNELLSCALNASVLAIMHAGICMRNLLASCTFCTWLPEEKKNAWMFLVYEKSEPPLIQLVSSHMEGFLFIDEKESDEKLLEEYVNRGAREVCPAIFHFYREIIINHTPLV
jgi:hypothetical protein